MRWETIHKSPSSAPPNLTDYAAACATFSWDDARRRLDGLPDGGLNIAHEAVDRHANGPRRNHVALRWLGSGRRRRELTYGDLQAASNRFAHVLRSLGVTPGERVFLLCARIPELYIAMMGAFKAGNVVCPLFSAFGPDPILQRMTIGDARVLVTTPSLYRRRIDPIRADLPGLTHVLLVGDAGAPVPDLPAGTRDWATSLAAASDAPLMHPTTAEDMALLHFTSGTTGKPKGAVHVHGAVIHHHTSAAFALDLHADDIYWCTADPGWVTGTSYGIIAPLTLGATLIVDEGDFDADRWYGVLADEGVTVWYTAPTAVRMMMKAGTDLARRRSLPRLRFIASVGEPLNPEAVLWGVEAFHLPIHDNWWQTETGGVMIANFAAMDIRPGSMGRPLPGIVADVVVRGADGHLTPAANDEEGELALRRGWPSMFRGYLNEDERYRRCFEDGWYLSGDLARRDADGYFWFVGRSDDVIKTAGHLIGPFEVETALLLHPGVAEAAVIGKPDPVAGAVIKAFVALKPGFEAGDVLRREILGVARQHLGPAVAPKELDFLANLPRTRSGKILRRLLKARELGLPEGDLSTLEPPS